MGLHETDFFIDLKLNGHWIYAIILSHPCTLSVSGGWMELWARLASTLSFHMKIGGSVEIPFLLMAILTYTPSLNHWDLSSIVGFAAKSLEKMPTWYVRVTKQFLEKAWRAEFTYKYIDNFYDITWHWASLLTRPAAANVVATCSWFKHQWCTLTMKITNWSFKHILHFTQKHAENRMITV